MDHGTAAIPANTRTVGVGVGDMSHRTRARPSSKYRDVTRTCAQPLAAHSNPGTSASSSSKVTGPRIVLHTGN